MTLFLIQYNRVSGSGAIIGRYDREQRSEAQGRLRALELSKPAEIEVVLLEGESETEIRKTHGRYFKTLRELALG